MRCAKITEHGNRSKKIIKSADNTKISPEGYSPGALYCIAVRRQTHSMLSLKIYILTDIITGSGCSAVIDYLLLKL